MGNRGDKFVVVLKNVSASSTTKIHVSRSSSSPILLSPIEPTGSIVSPGTARSSLTVGAVDIDSGDLAEYSSQGPTDDGRLKPEVTAPTAVMSRAYQDRFPGTSASSPHVAGFGGLILSTGMVSKSDLSSKVTEFTRAIGQSPDNRFGYGHIDGSAADSGLSKPQSRTLEDVLDQIINEQKSTDSGR